MGGRLSSQHYHMDLYGSAGKFGPPLTEFSPSALLVTSHFKQFLILNATVRVY